MTPPGLISDTNRLIFGLPVRISCVDFSTKAYRRKVPVGVCLCLVPVFVFVACVICICLCLCLILCLFLSLFCMLCAFARSCMCLLGVFVSA